MLLQCHIPELYTNPAFSNDCVNAGSVSSHKFFPSSSTLAVVLDTISPSSTTLLPPTLSTLTYFAPLGAVLLAASPSSGRMS